MHMRRRQAGDSSGFTLLEVMLAVFIVGTSFIFFVTAAVNSLSIAVSAKDYEKARMLLQRVEIEDPLQIDEVDGDDSDGGRFSGDFRDYSWKRVVTQVGEESDQLYQVTTSISWERGERDLDESMSRLLHVPSARKNGWIDENAD